MTVELAIRFLLAVVGILLLVGVGDVAMSRCPRLFLWIDQRVLRSRRRRRRETGRPWPWEIEIEGLDPFTPEQTRQIEARERARLERRR